MRLCMSPPITCSLAARPIVSSDSRLAIRVGRLKRLRRSPVTIYLWLFVTATIADLQYSPATFLFGYSKFPWFAALAPAITFLNAASSLNVTTPNVRHIYTVLLACLLSSGIAAIAWHTPLPPQALGVRSVQVDQRELLETT